MYYISIKSNRARLIPSLLVSRVDMPVVLTCKLARKFQSSTVITWDLIHLSSRKFLTELRPRMIGKHYGEDERYTRTHTSHSTRLDASSRPIGLAVGNFHSSNSHCNSQHQIHGSTFLVKRFSVSPEILGGRCRTERFEFGWALRAIPGLLEN